MSQAALPNYGAYMNLINRFPLQPITDDNHLDAALKMLEELMDRSDLTKEEEGYLSILADQINKFEEKTYPTPEVPPIELLKYLMKINNLKSCDLAPLFGGKSILSEILHGKRQLSKKHIANLALRFNLSPAAFFPEICAENKFP